MVAGNHIRPLRRMRQVDDTPRRREVDNVATFFLAPLVARDRLIRCLRGGRCSVAPARVIDTGRRRIGEQESLFERLQINQLGLTTKCVVATI
jgi:hypothetical protein